MCYPVWEQEHEGFLNNAIVVVSINSEVSAFPARIRMQCFILQFRICFICTLYMYHNSQDWVSWAMSQRGAMVSLKWTLPCYKVNGDSEAVVLPTYVGKNQNMSGFDCS